MEVAEIVNMVVGNSHPQSKKVLMPQERSGSPTKPPLVKTNLTPDEIMADYLDWSDMEFMVKVLSDFQKNQTDWEQVRRKIPDPLLEKWTKVLANCRDNGFIAPKIKNMKIVWKQIRGNNWAVDKCSLCPNSFVSGRCMGGGKMKMIDGEFKNFFKPCWEGR